MTLEKFEIEILNARKKAENYLISKYKLNYFDAQDVLQNACLKACKNFSSFRGKSSFETWYISIAKNEALSLLSKKKKSKEVEDTENLLNNYSYSWNDPEIFNFEKLQETKKTIDYAISFLSKKHKVVLNLMLKSSLSQEEISSKLNIPISSVRTRFFYAKKTLRKIISSHALNSRS